MRVEMAHLLVVIGHCDIAANTQYPLVWGVLTHEQPQERAFASPIRPHETHFLATVDRTGEAAQHRAVAIGLPDLAGDDHLMALALIGGEAQLHALVVQGWFLHALQTRQSLLTALRLFGLLPSHVAPDKLFL